MAAVPEYTVEGGIPELLTAVGQGIWVELYVGKGADAAEDVKLLVALAVDVCRSVPFEDEVRLGVIPVGHKVIVLPPLAVMTEAVRPPLDVELVQGNDAEAEAVMFDITVVDEVMTGIEMVPVSDAWVELNVGHGGKVAEAPIEVLLEVAAFPEWLVAIQVALALAAHVEFGS